ncbi:MAG: hypothetical protein ACRDVP_01465 [Acidimicrobiales bacterium]
MTLRRRLRAVRRRSARALPPRRLLGTGLLGVATGVAVWMLVLVVSENAIGGPVPSSAPTAPSRHSAHASSPGKATGHGGRPATPQTSSPVALGVYAGPGSTVGAMAFGADAGAPVPYAFDYIDGTSWSTLSNPAWFVQRWEAAGFQMIWGVPLLPQQGGSLSQGASGAYNAYFGQLARQLVAAGQSRSIIMLGSDPEDPTVPWSVQTTEEASQYVAFWGQVVNTMRAVPGAGFRFAWDAAAGAGPLPSALYPGDKLVNVVATDAFDEGSGVTGAGFQIVAQSPYGPDWFASFAASHHKAFMIAKWGVVPLAASGGGDNPAFVTQFLSWAGTQHVSIAVTWDFGTWALTGGDFPRSAAALRTVDAGALRSQVARGVDT